jgi:hypothetical protein
MSATINFEIRYAYVAVHCQPCGSKITAISVSKLQTFCDYMGENLSDQGRR